MENPLVAPRDSRADRIGRALHARHPLVAAAIVDAVGYLLVAAVMVALGVVLVEVIVPQGLGSVDGSMTDWMVAGRTETVTTLSDVGSRLADTVTAPGVAIVSVVVLLATRHRWEALAVGTAIALEGLLYLTVITFVSRARPAGVQLEDLPSHTAFPSGHTAASVAVYGTLAVVVTALVRNHTVRVIAWCIAVVVPLVVATSRVYRGEHSVSDTVAGLLMGTCCVVVAVTSVRVARVVARARSSESSTVRPSDPSVPTAAEVR